MSESALEHLSKAQTAFRLIRLARRGVESRGLHHVLTYPDAIKIEVPKVHAGWWILTFACLAKELDRTSQVSLILGHAYGFTGKDVTGRHVLLLA